MQTAVNRNAGAGDVGGSVAGQKRYQRSQFVRPSKSARGTSSGELVHDLLLRFFAVGGNRVGQTQQSLGGRVTGTDAVGRDTVFGVIV